MKKAIIGKKLGMSQIFTPDGTVIPVTVVLAGPCVVIQKKNKEIDGYSAIKVGYEEITENKLNKPNLGQFKKANVNPHRYVKELKIDNHEKYSVGDVIDCAMFSEGDFVDVTGRTRGRGFTGTVQRWGTSRGPESHGSGYHRGVGALAANTYPGRVLKNRKMPGQYGNEQITIHNLEVVRVDQKRNVILISGGIPGPKGSIVMVKSSNRPKGSSKWFKK